MNAPRLFGLLVVIVRLTVGNSSLIANDESLVLTAPQNLTSLTNRPNESSPALNINHRCDTIYGVYPDIGDCQDALAAMSAGSEQMIFGERNTGLPSSAIALPFLIFGKKGLCYIQPANVGDGPTAHASLNQIRTAANTLILSCVADADSRGGIAINIGGDDNLGVILGTYQPDVQCTAAVPMRSTRSCLDILADMPVTTNREVFGERGQAGVQEVLPLEYQSSDRQCILSIHTNGKSDSTSWYKIWQAAEAMYAVCNKGQGRGGWYRALGEEGNIFMLLTAPSTELPNNGSQAIELLNDTSTFITGTS